MKFRKIIDHFLENYTNEELIKFEKELHESIETEMVHEFNSGIISYNQLKNYQKLGYDSPLLYSD